MTKKIKIDDLLEDKSAYPRFHISHDFQDRINSISGHKKTNKSGFMQKLKYLLVTAMLLGIFVLIGIYVMGLIGQDSQNDGTNQVVQNNNLLGDDTKPIISPDTNTGSAQQLSLSEDEIVQDISNDLDALIALAEIEQEIQSQDDEIIGVDTLFGDIQTDDLF